MLARHTPGTGMTPQMTIVSAKTAGKNTWVINGKIEVFRLSSIFSGLSPGLGDCRLAEQAGLGCFQHIQRLLSPSMLVLRSPMPYRADDSSCGESDAAS